MPKEVHAMSTKAPMNPFAALTWDDVEAWVGSRVVSRGKSYQRSNRVQKLARTASGGIVAWVQSTSRYATQVEIAKKKLIVLGFTSSEGPDRSRAMRPRHSRNG
jgi:uncharacterized Zn finger protein